MHVYKYKYMHVRIYVYVCVYICITVRVPVCIIYVYNAGNWDLASYNHSFLSFLPSSSHYTLNPVFFIPFSYENIMRL